MSTTELRGHTEIEAVGRAKTSYGETLRLSYSEGTEESVGENVGVDRMPETHRALYQIVMRMVDFDYELKAVLRVPEAVRGQARGEATMQVTSAIRAKLHRIWLLALLMSSASTTLNLKSTLKHLVMVYQGIKSLRTMSGCLLQPSILLLTAKAP
ncbi:hypothetical protein SISSUDRAFT_1033328 [Sistotremastrum suecicum HHB10207 ss-3]|uniref:Uncharacterized protein n=1 Tax=Sistotremastrum suecicum HHB10207 ss-3 TaxID=1314776 RepID=A0A166DIJ2_9AGAM|nr:hypothetical protein SISSUDRAFT_1033328 [Sistotremastrum suecicum HHB10207 ss-3]